MPLNYQIKYERIEFGGDNSIDVRGLALPDISALVDAHAITAVEIFNKFTGRDANSFDTTDAAVIARELAIRFPAVSSHAIALAADAIDQYDAVSKLPIDVQVAALEKIGLLTFQMQGGLGNFVETVLRITKAANGLNAKISSPRSLANGSTGSTVN